ncbi:MAG: UDP-3-O-(3-hydroxymyristoyl)glucosamine N-acyltransferase [Candidatus Eremiobacteraeota bacterium]|nr:UDP-3-O-(3-hydroxymyristoyl)glucosamine N-acyltransferase [Candidatus Eremiobacteraeota bacterium]MBV9408644.1 UDP-3-O-(3-hydroxymyristoyl)glucosamine N-acyltransferase [Candidatus Eremiobacteraeota bacterium]
MPDALGTLGELAERVGGRVIGDSATVIERIAAVDDADATTLTFAVDARYLRTALGSRAAAVLTDEALVADGEPLAKPVLAVPSARIALAALLASLEPPRPQGPFVHPTAAVDPTAQIGDGVWIGPHVAVGARSRVGDRTVLAAGVVIGADAAVGADCHFHPRAYLADRCAAGDRVVLQAGAVIGSDGFGWAFLDGRLVKIPQVGTVELGDDVEIGANTCIDRAQTGVTSVGNGTKIDNLCQIGHNARIGSHSAIAAFAGLAGTTTIGDYVRVAGSVLFKGHITIGDRVTIAGASHIWGDVPDDAFVSGRPAQNHRDEVRLQAYLRRLPKLFARVDALEKQDPD